MSKEEAFQTILERWDISAEELTRIIVENPSVRGMLFGYVAEHHLHKMLANFPEVSNLSKADDHDRLKKGDCTFLYKEQEFTIESKSLQTNSIVVREDGSKIAKAQVDASDKRKVKLPNGTEVSTTCLRRGEFDVLAVNCFAFTQDWDFLYIKNSDLPASNYHGYTEYEKKFLLASLITVEWPPKAPYVTDLFTLLDGLLI